MISTEKHEKHVRRDPPAWKQRLKRHLPILEWLPRYRKMDLVADMIAGLTVGLTLIPQSVAYAGLAGVSPEYGLYSSFMGSFIYVLFGTVKEVSVGPTSLISLLTLEFTRDLPIEFVFLLTFMCGCVQFSLGLLQFGFLVSFISIPVTTSFQSATSLIIISSQIKDLLGLSKFKSGRFLTNILAVGERIGEARAGDVVLSIGCCVFLLSLRKLKDVKVSKKKELTGREKVVKKALWFLSISRNAICVFLSCALAYVFALNQGTPFKLSGNIPTGLPPFRPPRFSFDTGNTTVAFTEAISQIGPGILVIPLITILANVTIAKAFSVGTPVDATQEMITLGLCNVSGAFVSSLPTCGAFTRSAVSNSSGVRTPLAGLFTGTLILLVIRFLTPYFYYIPRATLASVLVCAVIFMIDWRTPVILWRVNKPDFLCSAITFSTCLLLGIQLGLLIGVAVNVGHLLYLWARPSVSIQVKSTTEGNYYMITPDIGLFYPATDFLRNKITRQCSQNIPLVIDCLHFKGIDYTTVQAFKDLGNSCKKRGQKLVFLNMNFHIYTFLKNADIDLDLKQRAYDDEELNNLLFCSDDQGLFSAVLLESEEKPLVKT